MAHIIHDVLQNSPAWHRLRCGIVTASQFDRVVTPAKGELSKGSVGLMYELLAEYAMGHPITSIETDAMARGTMMEEPAAQAFTFETGIEVERIGFVTTPDLMIGASPDRKVVGQNWAVEIKAPQSEAVHMRYLLGGEMAKDYRCQILGQMLVGEYDGIYAVSYHPELPLSVTPIARDEEYIAKMREALESFVEILLEKRAELDRRFGPFIRADVAESEPESDSFGITAEDIDRVWASAQARSAQ